MRIIVAHALVIAWMSFIFYMSAQPGDVSGDISGGVSHLFMQVWNAIFRLDWSEVEILQMAEFWDYPIRKLAHMTEFGILAMLAYWTKGRYMTAWIFTVIYAATDEIHQLFVPGRSGNGFDVCVDAMGALLALLLVWGIPRIVEVCKRRINYRKR